LVYQCAVDAPQILRLVQDLAKLDAAEDRAMTVALTGALLVQSQHTRLRFASNAQLIKASPFWTALNAAQLTIQPADAATADDDTLLGDADFVKQFSDRIHAEWVDSNLRALASFAWAVYLSASVRMRLPVPLSDRSSRMKALLDRIHASSRLAGRAT